MRKSKNVANIEINRDKFSELIYKYENVYFRNCIFYDKNHEIETEEKYRNLEKLVFIRCTFISNVCMHVPEIMFVKCVGIVTCYSHKTEIYDSNLHLDICSIQSLVTNYISGIGFNSNESCTKILNLYIMDDSKSISQKVICDYLYIENCEKLSILYGKYNRVNTDKYISLINAWNRFIVLYVKRIKNNTIYLDDIIKPNKNSRILHSIVHKPSQKIISKYNNYLCNNVRKFNIRDGIILYTEDNLKNIISCEHPSHYIQKRIKYNDKYLCEMGKYLLYQQYSNRIISFNTDTFGVSKANIYNIDTRSCYSIKFHEIMKISGENIYGMIIAIIKVSGNPICALFDNRLKIIRTYDILSDYSSIMDISNVYITQNFFIVECRNHDDTEIYRINNGSIVGNSLQGDCIIAVSRDRDLVFVRLAMDKYSIVDVNKGTVFEMEWNTEIVLYHAYFHNSELYCLCSYENGRSVVITIPLDI